MHVKNVKLINFRNYKVLNLDLNDNINIFFGDNAQGKTNLLEAIYICSNGKSYRTSNDKDLINIGKNKAYIGIQFRKGSFNKLIEIKYDKENSKKARLNKIQLNRISELVGELKTVIFSPEDLKLIKEGPSQRRNFLDTEISQIKPRYRYNISKYHRVLYQRNNMLKNFKFKKSNSNMIDVWDEQLSDYGSQIIEDRINFLNNLLEISKDIHSKITGYKEELSIKYVSFENFKEISKSFLRKSLYKKLKENLKRDIDKGITEIGPHRDDMYVYINGINCRSFGSQGQQRTAALSLKLAEVELIKSITGEYPVLLLDDVLSELDPNRRKYLVSTFKNMQTIITSTDNIDIEGLDSKNKSVFYIKEGNVLKK